MWLVSSTSSTSIAVMAPTPVSSFDLPLTKWHLQNILNPTHVFFDLFSFTPKISIQESNPISLKKNIN